MRRLPAILLLSVLPVSPSVAQNVAANPKPNLKDRGKGSIEIPLKRVIRTAAVEADPAASDAAPSRDAQSEGGAEGKASGFVNPKVEPGRVKWAADFDEAVKKAERSGRPVLLFQLIGRLDERFS